MVEKYKYDVFGKPSITDGSGNPLIVSANGNRFLFTGREWLAEVSLYDYRNRIYSADLGRFLQTDPIRFSAGDVNIYRYCENNSINIIDPLGAFGWSNAAQLGKGIAALFGAAATVAAAVGEEAGTAGLGTPLAAVTLVGAANLGEYGLGNIVAAFSSDAEAAEQMANSPSSPLGAAARALGGQTAQDIADAASGVSELNGAINAGQSKRVRPIFVSFSEPVRKGRAQ